MVKIYRQHWLARMGCVDQCLILLQSDSKQHTNYLRFTFMLPLLVNRCVVWTDGIILSLSVVILL